MTLRFLLIASLAALIPLTAFADQGQQDCPTGETVVCFADGACFCTKRVINMTDTPETDNACVDENDEGVCG